MRAGFIGAAALGLASFAIAQPHGIRHVHKREIVTDYVTVEREEIVVYLNEHDEPVATSTFWTGLVPTAAPAPSSTEAPAQPLTTTTPQPKPQAPPTSAPAPPPPPPPPASSAAPAPPASSPASGGSGSSPASSSSSSSSSPSSVSGSAAGTGFGTGISYAPYTNNGGCKSLSAIESDLNGLQGSYDLVRLYGTDCNQVANVIQAVSGKGKKIMAGVFDIDSWKSEVQVIIDAVKSSAGGNWDVIHTVSIGNENVNDGAAVDPVKSAVSSARDMLRSAGFQGSVVHVDTMVAFKNNPDLASTSDYVAMNCHPFFDGNTVAQDSGSFVQNWIQEISAIANGKLVVVTETGWPYKGSNNNKAVPSEANQEASISSIKGAVTSNVVLFSAYDEMWKTNNANTFNAEQYWGLQNH